MKKREEITIYVSNSTKQKLENDAMLFEVFKSNGRDINLNRFLGNLILGNYDYFRIEDQRRRHKIQQILKNNVKNVVVESIENVSQQILQQLYSSHDSSHSDKGKRISIKSTESTYSVIHDIKMEYSADNISQVFFRLFTRYLENPSYKREQIIYKESFDQLQEAIKNRETITFFTTKSPDLRHTVYPYMITTNSDELFNYLLCAEHDPISKTLKAKSYRLCRIEKTSIRTSENKVNISNAVKNHLDRMALYNPAYEINDDDECCVFVTEEGQKSYKMIYSQRPPYVRIIPEENGYLYYFDCSKEHVERYFRRFNPGEAVVKEPDQLRQRIISSYKLALESYGGAYEDT